MRTDETLIATNNHDLIAKTTMPGSHWTERTLHS